MQEGIREERVLPAGGDRDGVPGVMFLVDIHPREGRIQTRRELPGELCRDVVAAAAVAGGRPTVAEKHGQWPAFAAKQLYPFEADPRRGARVEIDLKQGTPSD